MTALNTDYMRQLIDKKYKNPAVFAAEVGVTRQHMHSILKGEREPSLSLLVVITTKLGVKVDKLLVKEVAVKEASQPELTPA